MTNPIKVAYRRTRWSVFWRTCRLPEVSLAELAPGATPLAPTITEHLFLPPYISPRDHDDAAPLLALLRALKPRMVLELGTAYGATSANICAVTDARVYTVNALPEQIQGRLMTFALAREDIGSVYRKNGFADRVTQIYENTWKLDLSRYLPRHSIDFAIVDACHDADFEVNDFLCVLPMLNENATVLFHDIHPSMWKLLGDGYIAGMYLRKMGYDVRHLKETWWAVWQARQARWQPPLLARAANAVDSGIVRLRGWGPTRDVKSLRDVWREYYKKRP